MMGENPLRKSLSPILVIATFCAVLLSSFIGLEYFGVLWVKDGFSGKLLSETREVLNKLEQNILLAAAASQKIPNVEKRQKINKKLYEIFAQTRDLQEGVARIEKKKIGFLGPTLRETENLILELDIVIAEIISATVDFSKYHQAKLALRTPPGEFFFCPPYAYICRTRYILRHIIKVSTRENSRWAVLKFDFQTAVCYDIIRL